MKQSIIVALAVIMVISLFSSVNAQSYASLRNNETKVVNTYPTFIFSNSQGRDQSVSVTKVEINGSIFYKIEPVNFSEIKTVNFYFQTENGRKVVKFYTNLIAQTELDKFESQFNSQYMTMNVVNEKNHLVYDVINNCVWTK